MMIQGKSCTLTMAKDGYYYPLPYSEETVRQASKGYALPDVIGIRNREKLVETGKAITGCVVTRLEYNNILALFLLLFYSNDKFDILIDKVCEKLIYKNVFVKEFELRAENKEAFYFRFDVKDNEDSFVIGWDISTPSLPWSQCRTFYYDGHSVIADLKTLPLVYRFELSGNTKMLYETYMKWCVKNNEKIMSQKWLALRMQEKGFKRLATNGQRMCLGLVMRNEWRT